MNFHILTLFPEMVTSSLMTSITGRAVKEGRIRIEAVNIRDFSRDKHKKVDDYPYGGGAGMLMQAQPVFDAYESVMASIPDISKKRVIYVTPQGTPFDQRFAEELAENEDLVFLCGHYEGIDERVLKEVVTDYISIGDYVLTGGELAAMVIIDAVARLVPGVLHNEDSPESESFHHLLLEYPQYSRPKIWHGKPVPEVLLSGNPKEIAKWRLSESEQRTKARRPRLYAEYEKLKACKAFLWKQKLLHIDMIESINRGNARLLAWEQNSVLLYDFRGDLYYLTADTKQEAEALLHGLPQSRRDAIRSMVVHQRELAGLVEQLLGLKVEMECYQAVYTKKEQLPVSGLYRTDGKETEQGLLLAPLTTGHLPLVMEHYQVVNDWNYLRGRIIKGCMAGAFIHGNPAGFAGVHSDGSLGMLTVLPKYRGMHVGLALETYLINSSLQRGQIPYGQVEPDNAVSQQLQRKLGLCFSKTCIYWMKK